MPDKKTQRVEVTDQALLDQLNSEDTPSSKPIADQVNEVLSNKLPVNKRELVMSQLRHETGSPDLSSHVALANNNVSGITWDENFPKEWKGTPRRASEGGYYVHFPSIEDWANKHLELLKKDHGAGAPIDSDNIEEFAHRLKKNGYYTAPESVYANGMKRMHEQYGQQHEEVTDPALLAQLNGEETPPPQKKSPSVSEPTLAASSQTGPGASLPSDNPPPQQPPAPQMSQQEVVNNIFGKDINNQPIVDNNNPPKEFASPPVATADKTKSAVATITNDYLESQHTHPQEMQSAFQNNPISHPENPLNKITDPNADPAYTGQYFINRKKSLEQEKTQAINSIPNNPEAPQLKQQAVVDITNQYNKKIADLEEASKHLSSLQIFKKEYENKPLTEAETGTKLDALTKQKDADIKAANKQLDEDLAGKDKADFNKADDERRTRIADINNNYQAKVNEIKSQSKWDGVRLGIERNKLLGDRQAEQDAIAYDAGKAISPARRYQYQLAGNGIKKTGVDASTNQSIAGEAEKHIESPGKIEADNIDYLKGEWANKIGNAKYADENPLVRAIVPHFGSMSDKDVRKYGRQSGLTESQISKIDPSQVPTSSTIWQQFLKGALNTAAPLYEQGIRSAVAITGGDNEAVNEHFQPGWENQRGPGAAVVGNMPSDQNSFHNVRGALGQMFEGAGGLSTFAGEVGGVSKAAELTGIAGSTASAEKMANFGVMAFNGYNSAYHDANEVIGDEPKDEWKRQGYAILNGLIEGKIFSISPKTELVKNALGIESKSGEQILNDIKKAKGMEVFEDPTFKENLANHISEITKENGKQVSLAVANQFSKDIINTIVNQKKQQDIPEDLKNTAISTALAMAIPSIVGGIGHVSNETPLNKAALFELGTNPTKYTDFISQQLSAGKITPEEAQTMHDGILTMKGIISHTPTANLEGKALTPDQVKDYSYNLFQEHLLEQKVDALTKGAELAGIKADKAQLAPLNKRIADLEKQRIETLKDAGTSRLPEPKQPEEDSIPADERSVAPAAKSEETTPAIKKEAEKLVNTEEKNIPLSSQEEAQNNVTEKTSENEKRNSRTDVQTSEQNAQDIRQEGSAEESNGQKAQPDENGSHRNEQPEAGVLKTEEQNKEKAATEQPLGVKKKRRGKLTEEPEDIPAPIKKEEFAAWDQGNKEGKPEDKTEAEIKNIPSDEKIGGGESFNEFKDRIHKAWEETKKDAKDQTVQFTHSSVMKMIEAGEEAGWDNKDDQLRKTYDKKEELPVGEKQTYKTNNGEIHLMRHAESMDGADNLTRTKDTPLSEKGKEEAQTIIPEALKEEGIKPSEIISDEQPRTAQTAVIVHKELYKADLLPPQPDKPLHKMTGGELFDYHKKLKDYNKNLDKTVLGDRYEEYNKAQRVSNSSFSSEEARKKADKTIDEIESGLNEKQQDALFGRNLPEGFIANDEDVRDYRDKIEAIESSQSENELAKDISQSLIDLNNAPDDFSKFSIKQKLASAAMNTAKRLIEERGYDGKKVTEQALKSAYDKFKDKEDAEFMLSKYIDFATKQPNTEPAPARSVAPPAKSENKTASPKEVKPLRNQHKKGFSLTHLLNRKEKVSKEEPHTLEEYVLHTMLGMNDKKPDKKWSFKSIEKDIPKGAEEKAIAKQFTSDHPNATPVDVWAADLVRQSGEKGSNTNFKVDDEQEVINSILDNISKFPSKTALLEHLEEIHRDRQEAAYKAEEGKYDKRIAGYDDEGKPVYEYVRKDSEPTEHDLAQMYAGKKGEDFEGYDDEGHPIYKQLQKEAEDIGDANLSPEDEQKIKDFYALHYDENTGQVDYDKAHADYAGLDKLKEELSKPARAIVDEIVPFYSFEQHSDKIQKLINDANQHEQQKRESAAQVSEGKSERESAIEGSVTAQTPESATPKEAGEKSPVEPNPERSVAPESQQEDKASATKERLKQIEDDLIKQKASQKLEFTKGKAAEIKGDKESAKKHEENWKLKEKKINDLNKEKEQLNRAQHEEAIRETYSKAADKIVARYEKNKREHEGIAMSSLLGLSHKIGDHIADFIVARVAEGVRGLANLHVAVHRAIRLAKEKFGDDAKGLSENDAETIKANAGIDVKPQESEPILNIGNEEFAKDILADIQSKKLTYDEAIKEVMDEEVSDRTKSKIINYIDWHSKDQQEHNDYTLRQPKHENTYLSDYSLTSSDEVSKYISGETLEDVHGRAVQFDSESKETQLQKNLIKDQAGMIGLAKNHSGSEDVLRYGADMLTHIKKLPDGPDGQSVKKLLAVSALNNELHGERIRMENELEGTGQERKNEINSRIRQIDKMIAQNEIMYRDITSNASNILNAARANRIYRNTYFHDLYTDKILDEETKSKKEQTEKALDETNIPDKVVEEATAKPEAEAQQEQKAIIEEKNKSTAGKNVESDITSKKKKEAPTGKEKSKSVVRRIKDKFKKEKAGTEEDTRKEILDKSQAEKKANDYLKGSTLEDLFKKAKEQTKKPC